MLTLTSTLLISTYVLGIITLIIVVKCYVLKIERVATISLYISYFLVFILLTFQDFINVENPVFNEIKKVLATFGILIFSIIIPMSVHRNRMLYNQRVLDIIIIFCWLILIGIITGMIIRNNFMKALVSSVLTILVFTVYSTIIIFFFKSKEEKLYNIIIEKGVALLVFLLVIALFILIIFISPINILTYLMEYGILLFSILSIVIFSNKLLWEIKKIQILKKRSEKV